MESRLKRDLKILYEDYKETYIEYEKLKKQNEYLIKRDNKLQMIEYLFENEPVDLSKLTKLVKGSEE